MVTAYVEARATIAALERLTARADAAVRRAIGDMAATVEQETKATLATFPRHAKGTPTPSGPGEPPAQVSTALRRSITVDGPRRVGFADYEAKVGPTVVYARVQELGGGPHNLPARPYLAPSLERARPALERISRSTIEAGLFGV